MHDPHLSSLNNFPFNCQPPFYYFYVTTVLSSAVQCSLSENESQKSPLQKPDVHVPVKPEVVLNETEIEYAEDESDTDSVSSDCSSDDWWVLLATFRA